MSILELGSASAGQWHPVPLLPVLSGEHIWPCLSRPLSPYKMAFMLTMIKSLSITGINHCACQELCKVLCVVDPFNPSTLYPFCAITRSRVIEKTLSNLLRVTQVESGRAGTLSTGRWPCAHGWAAFASMTLMGKEGLLTSPTLGLGQLGPSLVL